MKCPKCQTTINLLKGATISQWKPGPCPSCGTMLTKPLSSVVLTTLPVIAVVLLVRPYFEGLGSTGAMVAMLGLAFGLLLMTEHFFAKLKPLSE